MAFGKFGLHMRPDDKFNIEPLDPVDWPETEMVRVRSFGADLAIFTNRAGLAQLRDAIDARLAEIKAQQVAA